METYRVALLSTASRWNLEMFSGFEERGGGVNRTCILCMHNCLKKSIAEALHANVNK